MELSPKIVKSLPKIEQILYFLLLFSLFFPLRKVFFTNSAYQTGAYSDFTSFSLYLSDILIIGLFLLNFREIVALARGKHVIYAYTTWILGTLILNSNHLVSLNYYFLIRLLLLFIFYFTIRAAKKLPFSSLISWFIGLSAIQSLIALGQFINQKSLGLYMIGESHLSPDLTGVAKIVSHGTKFIRGYGTFPHPNLLSAFLVTAILFSLYKIFIYSSRKQKLLFSCLLVINIFGLTVTFSRAGIGAAILASAALLIWLAVTQGLTKRLAWLSVVAILGFLAAFGSFQQFLLTRATLTDDAVKERVFYNQIGLKIIQAHPLTGISLGTSVLHMQQFSPVTLQPWEIQPIHNYYLLVAAELGIVGAIIWLIFLLWHLVKLFYPLIKRHQWGTDATIYQATLGLVLIAFMFLMLFDHYFYTINQTQLLLWLVIGLIGREITQRKGYL